ncbi:glycosyltransferase family 4 protein [Proteus terrae]|uniref:glycosyltransferase family 4 protein n=1 Tax=Proteus terrae TaxID=1574161 RepID=UPI00301D90DE
MKKILFVFHDSKPKSGATASMLDIINNLLKKSDLQIFALIPNTKDGLYELLINKNICVFEATLYGGRHPVPTGIKEFVKYKIMGMLKIITTYFSVLKVYKKINQLNKKIDLVYSNTSDTYSGYFLSRLLKVKHVWHVREFGIEDQNCVHTIGDNQYYNWLSTSEKIIVISKALKYKLSQYINNDKLMLVYDDVQLADCTLKNNKIIGKPLKVLSVGTISEGKGQKFVIDAIENLNKKGIECALSIVGNINTEYAKNLFDYVEKNSINNISFLGFREDIDKVRLDYDIGIISSKAEAFGRVTIEGMATGLIMVASNTGANPELISDRVTGFLYKHNDLNSLLSVISYIYENRRDMQTIRENAIKFANKFDSGIASEKIYNLLKNL